MKRILHLFAPITRIMMRIAILLLTLLAFVTSCARAPRNIDPIVKTPPHPKEIHKEKRNLICLPKDFSVSPFRPLSEEEKKEDWGKEYRIALCFAEDFDLYRAITGFKRALCLLPDENMERRLELHYQVALSYYLGKKYVEAAFAIESTGLSGVDHDFPAYGDLLLMLYDSYCELGKLEHAQHIFSLIEEKNPDQAAKISLLETIRQADLKALRLEASNCENHAYFDTVLSGYEANAKSVRKAEALNALLPGAGYWYVGMKQTAVTAFLVNSLFIAAGAHFLYSGNTAAGIITLSLEGGWYFGGIYGAGLAVKQYNEQLYCTYVDKITRREQLFPLFMLKYSF